MQVYQMFINGVWVNSSDGKTINDVDPSNGECWAKIQCATPKDVENAVESAKSAFSGWSSLTYYQRASYLKNFVNELKKEDTKYKIALTETTSWGRQIANSLKAVNTAIRYTEFFIHAPDMLKTNVNITDSSDIFNYELREPLGVIAAIIPWNSPVTASVEVLMPAIIMGNTIVIKPSEFGSTPILEILRLFEKIGLPRGVINVITGDSLTGQTLISNPNISKIYFSGSIEVAKNIAKIASQNIIPCLFELGGKSPNIIFSDCDSEKAVDGASIVFRNNGQTCLSPSRLLLQKSIYNDFLEKLVAKCKNIRIGSPLQEESEFGPLGTKLQLEKTIHYVEIGKKEGATEILSDKDFDKSNVNPNGFYFGPTIFADVKNNMRIAREEIFGPILSVIPFEDEMEAIKIANDTKFGLTAGIWTKNLDRAHHVSRHLQAGIVWINTYHETFIQVPYGGYKQSGFGKIRGIEGLLEFSQKKNVIMKLKT